MVIKLSYIFIEEKVSGGGRLNPLNQFRIMSLDGLHDYCKLHRL